ncbi:haloacid dehalogenase [Paenibacillus sp. 1011MAR3C5]|uniref:HAD-IA family hydrolase n=1 Tax=Paenibacillus sp. 1011MAR3C5 TaxID=1675787 RepID=UPI000E6CED25|nr:HAD-IA family hydrolase [Paenibacillus sp. 1011MAR3C5]RJE86841.1 haloacid dehalogenase [Paenibacillus sp. 1011MAR3C5]
MSYLINEDYSAAAGARPQLMMDIGGVLATNLSPRFWNEVARLAESPAERLYAKYKEEVSRGLWIGHWSEIQFWDWIASQAPSLSAAQGQTILMESLTPLPGLLELPKWSKQADIHILSNHLSAWVDPILEPVRPYLSTVTISSQVGMSKPHRELYDYASRLLPASAPVLFIDDQDKNLRQGATIGWHTLQADSEGHWIGDADRWLDRMLSLQPESDS